MKQCDAPLWILTRRPWSDFSNERLVEFPALLKCQGGGRGNKEETFQNQATFGDEKSDLNIGYIHNWKCLYIVRAFVQAWMSVFLQAQSNFLFFHQDSEEKWFDCLAQICTALLIAQVNEGFTSGVITLLGCAASIEHFRLNRVGLWGCTCKLTWGFLKQFSKVPNTAMCRQSQALELEPHFTFNLNKEKFGH